MQVMLLGDSGVGKTCLLTRFRDGRFLSGNYITTVGIDFRVRDTLLAAYVINKKFFQTNKLLALAVKKMRCSHRLTSLLRFMIHK